MITPDSTRAGSDAEDAREIVESQAIRRGRFQRVRNRGYHCEARSGGGVDRCYIDADFFWPGRKLGSRLCAPVSSDINSGFCPAVK